MSKMRYDRANRQVEGYARNHDVVAAAVVYDIVKETSTNCGAQTSETSERRRNRYKRRALIAKRVELLAAKKTVNARRSAAQRARWAAKRSEMAVLDPGDKTIETAGDPDYDLKELPDNLI